LKPNIPDVIVLVAATKELCFELYPLEEDVNLVTLEVDGEVTIPHNVISVELVFVIKG